MVIDIVICIIIRKIWNGKNAYVYVVMCLYEYYYINTHVYKIFTLCSIETTDHKCMADSDL